MKCACNCCEDRVSTEGELCAFCAPSCFPPTANGQRRLVLTFEERSENHRLRAQRRAAQGPVPTHVPTQASSGSGIFTPEVQAAARSALETAFTEAKKELIPMGVDIVTKMAKKKLGQLG